MSVYSSTIEISTKGFTDIIDITEDVQNVVKESGIKDGIVNIFCIGSTGGITTVEYEPGLVRDLKDFFEDIIPYDKDYSHHNTWHDNNGAGHLRSSLVGPSLTVPVSSGALVLGTWQQIIFIDFDTRARKRKIMVQVLC